MQISAAHNGGKAANAGFPPLREEEKLFGEAENLQFDPTPFFMLFSPFFFSSTYGDVGHLPWAFSFCTALTHHHNGARRMTNPNGSHIEDAP